MAGPKAKRTPFPPRKRHGELEKRYLSEVIDSDVLFYFLGTKVFEFQKRFAAMYGRKHCIACSSGTAAVHIALGRPGIAAGQRGHHVGRHGHGVADRDALPRAGPGLC